MAVVTQGVTPTRSYSPFEGMNEAGRLRTAVPRGMLRFHASSSLTAKPVNDSMDLSFTCSLPPSFAYVFSTMSFEIAVDTATDWDANARVRIFNGLPNAAVGNDQSGVFEMSNTPAAVAADPQRILNYSLGRLSDWFSGVITRSTGAAGISVILQYHNSAAAVQAAGILEFNMGFYQYELNQAVRFPLNFPLPVGIR